MGTLTPGRGRVLAIYAGKVGVLPYRGSEVRSAIDKQPVVGAVRLGRGGVAGDEQADARYHGGPDQALCAYPSEHYAHWESQLGRELRRAAFGENLTTEKLVETQVCIGDVFEFGDALVQVTQPRTPCFKPAIRNRSTRLTSGMKDAGFSGFYLRVLRGGKAEAGMELVGVARPWPQVTVDLANRARRERDPELIEQVLQAPELGARYRAELRARLESFYRASAGTMPEEGLEPPTRGL